MKFNIFKSFFFTSNTYIKIVNVKISKSVTNENNITKHFIADSAKEDVTAIIT